MCQIFAGHGRTVVPDETVSPDVSAEIAAGFSRVFSRLAFTAGIRYGCGIVPAAVGRKGSRMTSATTAR